MRVTVGMIVGQIGAGDTIDELLVAFPYLEREDIMQALRFAARQAELGVVENDREATLDALRSALIEGENSWPSTPFNFDDFLEQKRQIAKQAK